MKNSINLARALGVGITLCSLAPAAYAQRGAVSASGIEKSLAGIRILQSYKTVLARYGAPTRIFAADDVVQFEYSRDAKGDLTGGVKGIQGSTPGGGAARGAGGGMSGMPSGMGGGMSGMPNMGGRGASGGMSGMPSGMGGGGPISGMPPGMSMGGMPGMGGRGGGSPVSGMPPGMSMGGMPGMGGRGANSGGGGMSGMPSGMGGGAAGAAGGGGTLAKGTSYADRGGFIWVYLNPVLEKATMFLFNKDGRLEVITEEGRVGGSITSRGITLGSKIQDVYGAYGWPESTAPMSEFLSLKYLQKNHLQLITVKNKARNEITVSGIVVVLRENQNLTLLGGSGTGGGGNPMMAGAGGAKGLQPGAVGSGGGLMRPGVSGGAGRKGGGDE